MLNVEYHVSKYTQIIAQLRSEITDLKGQLARAGGGSASGLREPKPGSGSNSSVGAGVRAEREQAAVQAQFVKAKEAVDDLLIRAAKDGGSATLLSSHDYATLDKFDMTRMRLEITSPHGDKEVVSSLTSKVAETVS